MQDRGFNSFVSNMIKLSVIETKWSSLLARIRALILCISIRIFDFGPEKLPGLSRNGPLGPEWIQILRHLDSAFDWLSVSSFVYQPIRMSRFLLCSALNYLFSAPCYLKTAFLLANHNRGIFSCIILDRESSRFDKLQIKV